MRDRLSGRLFGPSTGPRRIARFEVRESIGSGGMGVVYSGYCDRPAKLIAVSSADVIAASSADVIASSSADLIAST